MHDGKGVFLVEGLESGVHTAKVFFYGDEDYYARNATTTLWSDINKIIIYLFNY